MICDVQPTHDCPIVVHWTSGYDITIPKCTLVVESGPDAGKEFGPLEEQTTIGRDPSCQVRLTDPLVSAQHCELTCSKAGVRLHDLGSRNGVACNQIRLIDGVIGDGVRFTVGETTLRVRLAKEMVTSRSSPMDPTRSLVGTSSSMRRLFRSMEQAGPLELPVLLLGETGTGKTAIAEVIHNLSPRREGPFVDFNCAELNRELVESQLFGHARGAFTGAHEQTAGIFEQAHGGSLFLDEIGELPLSLQSKLLKVIERRCVRRLGASREVQVDVRIFAATNRNLEMMMAAGEFREDLYYRIAGMALLVPPLRDRLSDMGMLATWLTERAAGKLRAMGRPCPVTGLSQEAIEKLRNFAWPGNVRQLDNVIARAVEMAQSQFLRGADIQLSPFFNVEGEAQGAPRAPDRHAGDRRDYKSFKAQVEQQEAAYFKDVFDEAGGCIAQAARIAGISRNYMGEMARKHGLGGRGEKRSL